MQDEEMADHWALAAAAAQADSSDDDFAAQLEKEMEEAAAREEAAAKPEPVPQPEMPQDQAGCSSSAPPRKRRGVVRRRAPSAPTQAAPSSSGGAASNQAQDDEVGEVGYLWGMNVVTGELQDDAGDPGADDGASSAPMVQLTYGSYRGVELSSAEVARIKAAERKQLVAAKK